MKTKIRPLFMLMLLSLSGCNTLSVNDSITKHQSDDPLEGMNRSIYAFNDKADKSILRPVALAYVKTIPSSGRKGIRNFFTNLREPLNVLNNLLQGKVDRALSSTYRFAVNSTIGVFGFVDVASKYEVELAREDFGQTLAVWGVGPGPYLMIPFIGPMNLRNGTGWVTDFLAYSPIYSNIEYGKGEIAVYALEFVDKRSEFLGVDKTLAAQLDPYAFLKQAYEQNRINNIYDGNPPEAEQDDFDF